MQLQGLHNLAHMSHKGLVAESVSLSSSTCIYYIYIYIYIYIADEYVLYNTIRLWGCEFRDLGVVFFTTGLH